MANNDQLITWLGSKANTFDYWVEEYQWPHTLDLPWYDYAVKIRIGNDIFCGQGTSRSKVDALSAAIGEALERYVMKFYGFPTTNGLAVHLERNLVHESASNEIYERDSFLCHYLTRTPFLKALNDPPVEICETEKLLMDMGYSINFWHLVTAAHDKFVVLGSVFPSRNFEKLPFPGLRIGLACGNDQLATLEKAFMETLRYVVDPIFGKSPAEAMNLQQFKQLEWPSPLDHQKLAYHSESLEQFRNLTGNRLETAVSSKHNIKIEEFSLPKPIDDAPIFIARASNPRLQDLFFGIPDTNKINLERLSEFANLEFSMNEVNMYPHFLS